MASSLQLIMDSSASQYMIRHCFQCENDAEIFCASCSCNMCFLCNERHAFDMHTKNHVIMIYREKFNHIPLTETCVRHPGTVYEMYCESCKSSVCKFCKTLKKHKRGKHQHIDIRKAYETKRKELTGTIQTIRSESLFYRLALMAEIRDDITKTLLKIFHCQSSIKCKQTKDLIDVVMKSEYTKYKSLLRSELGEQASEMKKNLAYIQSYEMRYENLATRPLQYISFLKKTLLIKLNLTQPSHLTMNDSFKTNYVIDTLMKIHVKESKRQQIGNERLKELIPSPVPQSPQIHAMMPHPSNVLQLTQIPPLVLLHSLTVTGVKRCCNISCVTSDQLLVSNDKHDLVLINTKGDILHRLKNLCDGYGVHTLSPEKDLIYIDKNYNIKQLSKNMKKETTIAYVNRTSSKWRPRCIHLSPSTGDLLVGMYGYGIWTNHETQYYRPRQPTIKIQYVNKWLRKLTEPIYITENKNGDVVVCDNWNSAVVVIMPEGKRRFSYTGPPLGSGFRPCGICTDELSHILVCDAYTKSVQMITECGQFLSYLLIIPQEIIEPLCMSYDANTRYLWIGSFINNKVCVYEYKTRQSASTGNEISFI